MLSLSPSAFYVCVCVYIYVYICMRVYVFVCASMHVCVSPWFDNII